MRQIHVMCLKACLLNAFDNDNSKVDTQDPCLRNALENGNMDWCVCTFEMCLRSLDFELCMGLGLG